MKTLSGQQVCFQKMHGVNLLMNYYYENTFIVLFIYYVSAHKKEFLFTRFCQTTLKRKGPQFIEKKSFNKTPFRSTLA